MVLSRKSVQLQITDLAFDGKSVANLEGKVVFLDSGLPGETVLAEITRSRPRFDYGTVREILTPSDLRVPARCVHFGYCGGCRWQDLQYPAQLHYKKKQVVECLKRIGGLETVQVEDVIGSVELFGYRNKMEFSFHTTEEGGFTLGLHHRGEFDKVFDLKECHLQPELGTRIVDWVREFVIRNGLAAYDVNRHTGYMRFLVLRTARRTGQAMVNLVTNRGPFPDQAAMVKELREAFPEVVTIVHNQTGKKSNVAVGEIEKVLYGTGFIEERLFERHFRIRANSFFQTNTTQTESLYRAALDLLEPSPTDRLLDLYCGTGSIGLLVSEFVSEVVGVELVADAVAVARENAEINEIENVTFFHGDVKDYLKSLTAAERPFQIIVVDPPRAGLHPKTLKRLLRLSTEKILYISCNPATFARDAKFLVDNGYGLSRIRPVDMFPHAVHIELVGLFRRN
jgi:23S rRNA (uracil1939-C5)-methyltransferase